MNNDEPPQQQQQQHRRRLNPFLRKPLWVILEEECQTNNNQQVGASSTIQEHAHTGAAEIELPHRENGADGNDEHDTNNGRSLSFEYGEDHQDQEHDHHSPLAAAAGHPQLQTQQHTHHHQHALPPRHLTLFDLVSIGVGGTIGSGIFVLNGLIAHSYAGPATFISWIVSGVAALLSGCCYAELSGRIPSAGSSYA